MIDICNCVGTCEREKHCRSDELCIRDASKASTEQELYFQRKLAEAEQLGRAKTIEKFERLLATQRLEMQLLSNLIRERGIK